MNGLWLCLSEIFVCNYLSEEFDVAIQDCKNQIERSPRAWNVKLNGQQIYSPRQSYPMPPRPESSAGPAKPSSHIARDGVEIVGRLSERSAEESSEQLLRQMIAHFEDVYTRQFPPPSKTSADRPRRLAFIWKEEQQKLRGQK